MTEHKLYWLCTDYSELTVDQLFDLLKLRQDVFILEQECLYPDIDGKDKACHHLLGYKNNELVAYLRIVPPGLSFQQPSIGRVATSRKQRGTGIGHLLMQEGIRQLSSIYPGKGIRIGAQKYLEDFYRHHGFSEVGQEYDEDGILHIDMVHDS